MFFSGPYFTYYFSSELEGVGSADSQIYLNWNTTTITLGWENISAVRGCSLDIFFCYISSFDLKIRKWYFSNLIKVNIPLKK